MAKPEVVADVGRTIKALLAQGLTGLVADVDIKIFTPDQMKGFSFTNPSVTIFLYHLSINAERRNSGTLPLGNGKFTRQPLPLDLRYLITPWVKDTSDAHTVCGYIMRALYDNDSVGPSDLVGNSWAQDDTLQLVLESLPVDEHYDIWQPTGLPYRLSLSYLARVIGLDSAVISSAAPVITANFGGP